MLRDNQTYSPSHIINDILREHRIHIAYSKAWKAREIALSEINGSYIDAYGSLENYALSILKTNPESTCFIHTSSDNRFKRIFVCFKACIVGFLSGCLPIMCIDATFLTSKYECTKHENPSNRC